MALSENSHQTPEGVAGRDARPAAGSHATPECNSLRGNTKLAAALAAGLALSAGSASGQDLRVPMMAIDGCSYDANVTGYVYPTRDQNHVILTMGKVSGVDANVDLTVTCTPKDFVSPPTIMGTVTSASGSETIGPKPMKCDTVNGGKVVRCIERITPKGPGEANINITHANTKGVVTQNTKVSIVPALAQGQQPAPTPAPLPSAPGTQPGTAPVQPSMPALPEGVTQEDLSDIPKALKALDRVRVDADIGLGLRASGHPASFNFSVPFSYALGDQGANRWVLMTTAQLELGNMRIPQFSDLATSPEYATTTRVDIRLGAGFGGRWVRGNMELSAGVLFGTEIRYNSEVAMGDKVAKGSGTDRKGVSGTDGRGAPGSDWQYDAKFTPGFFVGASGTVRYFPQTSKEQPTERLGFNISGAPMVSVNRQSVGAAAKPLFGGWITAGPTYAF